ncbi:MAG: sulfite exporter TauE/SafE family protein [Nitrospinota bacterium]
MWVLGFLLLGLAVGVIGALVGAGGGFILTPVLLFLMPREAASLVTATSLTVVCINLIVSTGAYARLRRVDLRSGLLFGCAALPGAVLGVVVNSQVGRGFFDLAFGLLLLGMAALAFRPPKLKEPVVAAGASAPRGMRRLRDARGRVYTYAVRERMGAAVMAGVGFFPAFFGIGGGPIITPLFIRFFGFPVHVGTATAIFVQMLMISTAVLVHLSAGHLRSLGLVAVLLAAGVMVGAPLGARLSHSLGGVTIARILAALVALMALLLLWKGLRAL